jgi:hypothetical protein
LDAALERGGRRHPADFHRPFFGGSKLRREVVLLAPRPNTCMQVCAEFW